MKTNLCKAMLTISLLSIAGMTAAAPAVEVLGSDYQFPQALQGLPGKLSDFKGLQINSFKTSDGVTLRYWEAGSGKPIIFVPGWSANGAEYINVMFLLAQKYRVIVLDQRNQGLSDKVNYGNRISRYAADLKEMTTALNISSADYCGWSMGASVLWSYIDLFGSKGIRKAVFVDEPVSILSRSDWSAETRRQRGALVPNVDMLIQALQAPVAEKPDPQTSNFVERFKLRDALAFANSEGFATAVIRNDPAAMMQVMYDHASNDWSDVLQHKLTMPVAIFTGEYSANLPSQQWAQRVMPDARLYVYTKQEQGDHFLMFKNPFKFTQDLRAFLEH
jgi:non-heme chloroperoxidase